MLLISRPLALSPLWSVRDRGCCCASNIRYDDRGANTVWNEEKLLHGLWMQDTSLWYDTQVVSSDSLNSFLTCTPSPRRQGYGIATRTMAISLCHAFLSAPSQRSKKPPSFSSSSAAPTISASDIFSLLPSFAVFLKLPRLAVEALMVRV